MASNVGYLRKTVTSVTMLRTVDQVAECMIIFRYLNPVTAGNERGNRWLCC